MFVEEINVLRPINDAGMNALESTNLYLYFTCGVMVTLVGKRLEDPSSNPGGRLFAFCVAIIYLGKVCIQIFSFLLWVNSRAEETL